MGHTHMWFRTKPTHKTPLEKLAEYRPHPSLNWHKPDWVFSPPPSPSESVPTSPLEEADVPWMAFEDELTSFEETQHSSVVHPDERSPEAILGELQKEIMMEVMDTGMLECSTTSEETTTPEATSITLGPMLLQDSAEATLIPVWAAPIKTWTRRVKQKAAEAKGNPAKRAKRMPPAEEVSFTATTERPVAEPAAVAKEVLAAQRAAFHKLRLRCAFMGGADAFTSALSSNSDNDATVNAGCQSDCVGKGKTVVMQRVKDIKQRVVRPRKSKKSLVQLIQKGSPRTPRCKAATPRRQMRRARHGVPSGLCALAVTGCPSSTSGLCAS